MAFVSIIGIAPLIAGFYGILHDQLTYSISPEYYTKFKFHQFGLTASTSEAIFEHPRLAVSLVGFMATWWVGIFIGLILAFVALAHKNNKEMLQITLRAMFIAIITAFFIGLTGLIYGKFHLSNSGVSWWLPPSLIDKANFIAVGSMHNFSYVGGIIGLLAGVIYSLRQKNKPLKT